MSLDAFVNLAGAKFDGATFSEHAFVSASFAQADLSSAHFNGTEFGFSSGGFGASADFTGAILSREKDNPQEPCDRYQGVTFENVNLAKSYTLCNDDPFNPRPEQLGCVDFATAADTDGDGVADLKGVSFVPNTTLYKITFDQFLVNAALFAHTDLREASFEGADIAGVDLSEAILDECARFDNATFSVATGTCGPTGPPAPNVSCIGINLGGTACAAPIPRGGCSLGTRGQLAGADFLWANLEGAQFVAFADLTGVTLRSANLNEANLSRVNLEGANLNGALLHGANLTFTDLHMASMVGAQLDPLGILQAADLTGAFITDVDLSFANLQSVNLTDAHLYGESTNLSNALLDRVDFEGTICSGAVFIGASMVDATFNNALLVQTRFDGADLTRARFNKSYLHGADFSGAASVNGASLVNSAVALTKGSWSFIEQDGTPFTLMYEATNLGDFALIMNVVCPNGASGPCDSFTGCDNAPQMMCETDDDCPTGGICTGKLIPSSPPFPPVPICAPAGPGYCNCLPCNNTRNCNPECAPG